MTEAELKTELQAGKSIADVAKAKNIDLDTVIAKLTAAFKAHLDEEVASGKHTQAEADAKLAEFSTRVTTMVNAPGLPMHGGKGGHGPQKFATAQLATTLKLTEAELQTQLKSGKTIKQIADAQNVDIADVKTTLTAAFKAHLDEEVASGEHTQAEADAKLAEFKTRLDDMVNGVRPVGGKGGHGPGGKGGRGGHGHGGGHQFSATPGAPA
jgi:lipoate-protein ligase A